MNAPFRPAIDWSDLLQAAPYFSSAIPDLLSPEQALDAAPLVRAAYFYDLFDGQVSNGGVMQYFYNLALSTPGFERVPKFIAQNPALAQALPFVEMVHAAWAGVAPEVAAARDSDEWPETGMVGSWTSEISPDAELVNTMLDAAIETVADTAYRPVVHSDRGGHYRWPGWLSRMEDANLTRSMSRKACSPDNAACEG